MANLTFEYLGNKSWSSITRDERYFCAHLFKEVWGKEASFVKWLNTHAAFQEEGTSMGSDGQWEVAVEVCFFRDFFKSSGSTNPDYSLKRTFDLCLFSEETIVIVEAKVQQPLSVNQSSGISLDVEQIENCIIELVGSAKVPRIVTLALVSSKYIQNLEKYGDSTKTLHHFDGWITWDQLSDHFHNEIFTQADTLYKM